MIESTAVAIPYVHVGMGAALAIASIPLILRRVPMNHFYGFRIRKAFVSLANWEAINAFGGKMLLIFGLLLVAYGFLSQGWAPSPRSVLAPLFLVAPLVAAGVAGAILLGRFASRLPDK